MKEIDYSSSIETICKAICNKDKYNYYRIIKNPYNIEVKLSPKKDLEQEIVWTVENNKQSKSDLKFSLLRVLEED